jgi:hypothetical protein
MQHFVMWAENDDLTGSWTRFSEELHKLCYSDNIIKVYETSKGCSTKMREVYTT